MCRLWDQCRKPTKRNKNQMIVSESHHLSYLIIMDTTVNNLMFISVESKPYVYNEIFIECHLAEDLLEKYYMNVCIVNVKVVKLNKIHVRST